MKPHEQTILNKVGKRLAKSLSYLVANSMTESYARLAEAYWCVLLGKGAGTGWALDAEIDAAASTIMRPAPVILDVGANVGEWSFQIQRRYPQASLFLFEPQPACQVKIAERNLANAVLIPNAVSDRGGQTIMLYTRGGVDGVASLHERRDSIFKDRVFSPIEVHTVSIDEMIERYGLPRVDFMKIDVEGHELAVLKGALSGLQHHTIKALSFEFGSGNINSRTFFHDFWDLLSPLGYCIYRILPSSRLMPIAEYYEDCEYFRGVTNYIAVLRNA